MLGPVQPNYTPWSNRSARPTPPSADLPATERRGPSPFMGAFLGCFAGTVVLGLLVAGCAALGFRSFVHFGINDDLMKFRRSVSGIELEAERREALLKRIDAAREAVRTPPRPGFLRWIEHSEAVRALIEDDRITDHEYEMLLREFEAVELESTP
jgi:hypothetical protein